MVTTKDKYPGPLSSLSILVYNFDDNVSKSLKRIGSNSDLMRIIRNYDGETEFLVRCNGFSGEYRILRRRIVRDNFIQMLEVQGNEQEDISPRHRLINEIAAAPRVQSASVSTSDALSIRSIFKGIGAELILIDRK